MLAFHLKRDAFPQAGSIAVWLFFMISGYLVSKILYETYQNRPADFVLNRFLRLFPAYWTVLIFGFALLLLSGGGITDYHPSIALP